ncbi:hypothetical protein E1265_02315 [Streptomyces sp. 8K308]|uniref:hypothetical protein n=1 Tax=Streptomyces sp. 8K308 TaxID=2530388 RepID=UPI001047CD64|nr:hypothetical protein [Streptomyces sp. 8K308]TDC27135.1 hypothetical protein E1265_02315 [Streptomyces sp. 8K308]
MTVRDDHDSTSDRSVTAKVTEAIEARDVLADALRRAGIQLSAMDIRRAWPGTALAETGEKATRYAFVQLGFCSAPVALALAAVITKGTER